MPGERDITKNIRYLISVEGAESLMNIFEKLIENSESMISNLQAQGVETERVRRVVDRLFELYTRINQEIREGTWNEARKAEIIRETLSLMDKENEVFRQMAASGVNVGDAARRLTRELETSKGHSESLLDIWNKFARAVGLFTVPTSLLDIGTQLIRLAESLNRATYGIREMMALPGAEPMGMREAGRLEMSFRALALRVGESEEAVKSWIAGLKSSEVLYETVWGREFQRLTIEAASGSLEAHEALDAKIEETARAFKAFELTTGYSASGLQNFAKFMTDATRMDFPEIMGAYKDLADRARIAGVEFNQFTQFFKEIYNSYRMYGITLTGTMDILTRFGEELNMGILTTRDFVQAMELAKNAMDPNKAGTIIWFMANFSQTPEVREAAQRALQAPGGPAAAIGALQFLVQLDPEKLRREWDALPESMRRQVEQSARIWSYEGPVGQALFDFIATFKRDWSAAMATIPVESAEGFQEASMMVTGEFQRAITGTTGIQNLMDMIYITSDRTFKQMDTSVRGFQLTAEEAARYQEEYSDMVEQGSKVMDEHLTPLKRLTANFYEAAEAVGAFSLVMRDFLEIAGVGAAAGGAAGVGGLIRGGIRGGGGGGGGGGWGEAALEGAVSGLTMRIVTGPMMSSIASSIVNSILPAVATALPFLLVAGIPALIGFEMWQTERREARMRRELTQVNNFTITGPSAEEVARKVEENMREQLRKQGTVAQVPGGWTYAGL